MMVRLFSFKKWFAYGVLILASFSISSCVALRMQNQLDQHRKYLADLAENNMDPESKLELIALDLIDIMNESLQYRKARQSHSYIKKYLDKNEQELNALYDEIADWYSTLTILEKGQMIGRQVQKPYVRELKKLIPEVEQNLGRKIRTYKRIYRFFDVFFPLN